MRRPSQEASPRVPRKTTRSAPARPRRSPRTQEQRSASTRAKVVAAATECVAELGFRGATMGAIAERAGVSWGAIQHQFGEKDALLDAVLEEAIRGVQRNLSGIVESNPDPVARVKLFLRRCRQMLSGPIYKAFVEIQMARSREASEQTQAWAEFVGDALNESWLETFGDLELPKRRLEDAQRFTFAVLSGIAAETMLFPNVDFTARHLRIVEQTLLRLLDLGDLD